MICLRCDNEEFKTEPNVEIEQEYKGETLFVRTTASICTMCGYVTVTPEQADELHHKTELKYIERNLPTRDGNYQF